MLVLTAGLGVWQIQRLAWKRALLAQIDLGEASPPIPLSDAAPPFTRVVVVGRFQRGIARYGLELRSLPGKEPTLGTQVLSALIVSSGLPVIVDRGWVPLDTIASPPEAEVQIEGYIRPPEQASWFGPYDDAAKRQFYALDPVQIGASLGLAKVAPFTLVALGNSTSLPIPAGALPRPPNDHLSYAITWFSLAAALTVVFTLYVRSVSKYSDKL